MNLQDFLHQSCVQHHHPSQLSNLVLSIAKAGKQIAALLAKGDLAGTTQQLQTINVQGEAQMQLDVSSHEIFIDCLAASKVVFGAVSEELAQPYYFTDHDADAPYLVCFDPLDGSSNLKFDGVVGSIFSILPAPKHTQRADEIFLQAGANQIAAGYVLYGPATMLVLTLGAGVHAFTLNPATQLFELTHADLKIPPHYPEFAINASRQRFWEAPMQQYISDCLAGEQGVRQSNFNMRWMASMVADIHRILMRGGVFLYPKDWQLTDKGGRLRLLYEVGPMSFLVEQAGGKSSTGRAALLSLKPEQIHQRVPAILGSSNEVDLIEQYHKR
jgi:fructose-1,6-bisphosphatase